jgi:mono/diheme cytochrome c family protein
MLIDNQSKEADMAMRKTLLGLLLLPVCGFFCAAQQVEIKKVPIKEVSPASGQQMYVSYCGACHGAQGRGNGPAAKALKTPPPDLTALTKSNHGVFPEMHVYTIIRGDDAMPAAHGEKDMPVWGNLFMAQCGVNPSDAEVHQRIGNLTKYVESLQKN